MQPNWPIHFSALATALIAYALLGSAFFGLGRGYIRALGYRQADEPEPLWLVWLGWVVYLLFLLTLHLLLPLQAYVVAPPLLLGLALFFRQQAGRKLLGSWRQGATCVLALPVTVWVASRAMLAPDNYDSGLYHLQSIRWDNTYPIVPGSGNLHERLAFNQSFFEFVAALNFQPYFGHGSALANSFLYLLGLATLIQLVPWRRPQEIFEGCPLGQLAALLPIPYLLYLGTNFSGLNSPSPDLAGEILQILLLVGLAQETSRVTRGQPPHPVRGAILTTLGVAAITLKLSNLIFAVLAILLLMTLVRWDARRSAHLLCPAVMLLTLWVGRGYLLSGMPLYPLSAGRVPFEWAMPAIHADESRRTIAAWARLPGPHFREATTGWKWLGPWWVRITALHQFEVVYPLALSALALPVALWLGRRLPVKSKPALWLVPTGAIVFWFVVGPEPRFGRALFWCLWYASSLSLLQQLQTRLSPSHYLLAVIALMLLCSRPLLRLQRLDAVSVTGWHGPPEVAMRPEKTATGLVVWVPKKGDQAWDAALPSTPYFRREVRLRVPGRLESGFAWGR